MIILIKINTKSVRAKLYDLQQSIIDGTEDGAKKAAQTLLELSRPLVPIDTGALKKSGRIRKIQKKNISSYEVVYSKASPDGYNYAAIQHEDVFFKHPKGGQAKYLEQPLREHKELLGDIIATMVKTTAGKRRRKST